MIRIAHENFDTVFDCRCDTVNTLVVENPGFYRELIGQFVDVLAGGSGKLAVSDGINSIKVKDDIVFIRDFFALDVNRKINNLLIKQIVSKITVDTYRYNEIYQKGYKLLSELLSDFGSEIDLNETMDVSLFLKLYNPAVRIETSGDKLDALTRYIDALVEFVDLKLVIFLGIENYFNEEELNSLFKHCTYKELSVFLLESRRRYKLKNENCVIIDKDLCEIIATK